MSQIEVAELIGNLRKELSAARDAGAGEELRFEVGPVELELSVVVSRDETGSAKIRFWVLELGGDGKSGSSTTQKLKITLLPRLATGKSPLISGPAAPNETTEAPKKK